MPLKFEVWMILKLNHRYLILCIVTCMFTKHIMGYRAKKDALITFKFAIKSLRDCNWLVVIADYVIF